MDTNFEKKELGKNVTDRQLILYINHHNCLRHIFGLPMRWFSTQKDVLSYQYEIFHFHFLVRHNLKLDFSQFKTNINRTGDKPCNVVAMEQNLEHDIYMKENFSERVVNIQREKSNKCSLCDFASIQAGNLRTHLKTPEFIFVGTGGTGGRVKFLLTA